MSNAEPKFTIIPIQYPHNASIEDRKLSMLNGLSTAIEMIANSNTELKPYGKNWKSLYGLPTSTKTILDHLSYKKYHLHYVADYFSKDLNPYVVHTIVLENEYLSKTFFNDHRNFYASIFGGYHRLCSRIHFLGEKFDNTTQLQDVLMKSSVSEQFVNSYYGFMVLRPLPEQIVGSSLFRPYPSEPEKEKKFKRKFTSTRNYDINFYGKDISFDSLIFTSQDHGVGACASYALWMSFHKTYKLFKTPLPPPSEITKKAGKPIHHKNRIFPNKGLDHFQIIAAIESIGLEPEFRSFTNIDEEFWIPYCANDKKFHTQDEKGKNTDDSLKWENFLDVDFVKSYIYAYAQAGIPALMGIKFTERRKHLITIAGYKEGAFDPNYVINNYTDSRILLRSSRIKGFYCHDDNVGAFSKLSFQEDLSKILEKNYDYGSIITGWLSDNQSFNEDYDVKDEEGMFRKKAKFEYLCLALDPSIRLSHEDIFKKITTFDSIFDLFKKFINLPENDTIDIVELSKLEWEIYLISSSEFRKRIYENTQNEYDESFLKNKVDILTTTLPNYIWVAKGRKVFLKNGVLEEQLMLEMLFDSTETPSAYSCKLFNFSTKVTEAMAEYFITILKKDPEEGINYLSKIGDLLENLLDDKQLTSFTALIEKFAEEILE